MGDPLELASYYLGGREETTINTYKTSYRRIWRFCQDKHISLFGLGESEVMSLLIGMSKEGCSEGQFKQVLATVTLISEVCGWDSPTKSNLVMKVKLSVMKKANNGRRRREKKGMTIQDIKSMLRGIYRKPSCLVRAERRRFLLMQLFLYFGVRRFSDINCVKVNNVSITENGDLKVWVEKHKTDKLQQGMEFMVTGKMMGKFSVRKVFKWYRDSFASIPEDGYLFPVFKGEEPLWHKPVTYSVANSQLKREKRELGLSDITLHSGRVGAATRAAKRGVERGVIKKAGNWVSDAVDVYVKIKEPGLILGDALLKDY